MCITNDVTSIMHDRKIDNDYHVYLEAVEKKINSFDGELVMFHANPAKESETSSDLFNVFLNSIPEELRQHYNCNTCRSFFRHFGWLVTIDGSSGLLIPVVWPDKLPTDNFFYEANEKIRDRVIHGVVERNYDGAHAFGTRTTFGHPEFTHFYGQIQKLRRCLTGYELYSPQISDFLKYSSCENPDAIKQAIQLLGDPRISLREKYKDMAEEYLKWIEIYNATKNNVLKRNLAFYFLSEHPALLHVRSSMVGSLLSDIKEGLAEDLIIQRFNEKTDPTVYAKKTAAASVGNLKVANEIIQGLNLESALYRRIAYADEVKAIWRKANASEPKKETDFGLGLFEKINPSKKEVEEDWGQRGAISVIQLTEMLDNIEKVFIKIPSYVFLGGITCPARDGAGNLLRHYPYGSEGNQFSTYFYTNNTLAAYNGSYWNEFTLHTFYEVNTICWKPWHWDVLLPEKKGFEKYDQQYGVMFLIDGLKDTHTDIPGIIFDNTIRSDIRSKVGRAVYQLTKELPLEGVHSDPDMRQLAYGLCYAGNSDFDLPIRMIMKNGERFKCSIISFK